MLDMTLSTDICIHGTCGFQCHCADRDMCRDDVDCECAEGHAGIQWSGPSCQVGNIANLSSSSGGRVRYTKMQPSYYNLPYCSDGIYNTCCAVYRDFGYRMDFLKQFVLRRIFIHGENSNTDALNTITACLRSDTEECISVKPNDEDPQTIYLYDGRLASSITLKHSVYRLGMCEVVVLGYEYVECEMYAGEYYYGPGCSSICSNCAEKCDFITGECLLCNMGYIPDDQGSCMECPSGRWGVECKEECNCENREEECDYVTGACTVSGCKDWYTQVGCGYRLPRLRNTKLQVDINGTEVNIRFTPAEDGSPTSTVYQVRYHTDEGWGIAPDTYFHSLSKDKIKINTQLPELNVNYNVCVVPYDIVVQMDGEWSECVFLFTDGPDYKEIYNCSCNHLNEICKQIYGEEQSCKDKITDDDSAIIFPTDHDIAIIYTSKQSNSIHVEINVDKSYMDIYSIAKILIEVSVERELLKSVIIAMNDTRKYVGTIDDLENSLSYQLSATPFIRDPDFRNITHNGRHINHVLVIQEKHFFSTSSSEADSKLYIIIIALLAGLLCVSLIVHIVLCIVKRRRHQNQSNASNTNSINDEDRKSGTNIAKQEDKHYVETKQSEYTELERDGYDEVKPQYTTLKQKTAQK